MPRSGRWFMVILGLTFVLTPGSYASEGASDEQVRRQEAIENIQAALDEDPDEAAQWLGSTPVNDLDLESLETLGDRALLFVQQKELERRQEQREERDRLRDLQNYQNSRR